MSKLLIFDFDGTIVNSKLATQSIIDLYCKDNGIPKINANSILVSSDVRIIKEWDEFSDSKYYSVLYNIYCEIDNKLGDNLFMPELFLDIKFILKCLFKSYKLAIYTSNSKKALNKILTHYKIDNLFTICKTYEDCEAFNIKPKPNPEMLEIINKDLKFDKNNIYYIGDTNKDLLFARNANINSIFVNWGYGKILNKNNADLVLNSPKELLTL